MLLFCHTSQHTKNLCMKKNKYLNKDTHPLYIVSAIVFALTVGMLIWFFQGNNSTDSQLADQQQEENKQENGVSCSHRRALDGICVEKSEDVYPELVAVMIENHPDARPQSGLFDARVVYEAPVEANYSRFMAVFPKDMEVEKVGPVRSARPYYVNWAQEYAEPMYMHVGGSSDALEKIDQDNIFDMDEFYRGWYFWRSTDRFAPHNTYTSNKLWQKAWDNYGKEKKSDGYAAWTYSDDALSACTDTCANTITATFLAPTYEAVWKYNTSTRQYERYQGGKPHVDQNGKQIVADTVIVQKMKTNIVDDIGRLQMDTIGTGKVFVFRDGQVIEGNWQKETKKTRTRFLSNNGDNIALRSGKIWIEVINQVGSVLYQ